MTLALHQRRRAEIQAKLSSLNTELDAWSRLTETGTTGFGRHRSQVRALVHTLTGLVEHVQEAVKVAPADNSVFEQVVTWEKEILAAHSIWEVFRSKLVLRQSDQFRASLGACDDLAWACYEPSLKSFSPGAIKVPPLVFLSSTWSPFAQSRDSNFQNEIRAPDPERVLTGEIFRQVLRRLPVPLVGLPWYQVVYVPGSILLAHEVGHVVEWDFGLTESIETSLVNSGAEHADLWLQWRSEVFADLYGCLAMGPAYVGALMDLLTTSVSKVQSARSHSGNYPTRAMRVELLLTALSKTGFDDDSKRRRATWEAAYGEAAAGDKVKADVPLVVDAIYGKNYRNPVPGQPNLALKDVISFAADGAEQKVADYVAGNRREVCDLAKDPRTFFAAAQLLHEQPPAGFSNFPKAFERLVSCASREGMQVFRFRGKSVDAKDLAAEVEKGSEQLKESGRLLRDYLGSITSDPPP
jgi:hypothetical protein